MIVRVNVVLNRTVVVDRVLMLERSCSHSNQCHNNVATLCCAKNRRCESPITLLKKVHLLGEASLYRPGKARRPCPPPLPPPPSSLLPDLSNQLLAFLLPLVPDSLSTLILQY